MIRFLAVVALVAGCVLSLGSAEAQERSGQVLSGFARAEAAGSLVRDRRGGVEVTLKLSQGVPYRVYTLDDPKRLVADFREVDFRDFPVQLVLDAERVSAMRVGAVRPGWSRMVLDLTEPMVLSAAEMAMDRVSGSATLSITLRKASEEAFAAASGVLEQAGWDMPSGGLKAPERPLKKDALTVVIDPGHGGIDPGAEGAGMFEKDIMLAFAKELSDAMLRAGNFDVVMTRADDSFVSLERRVAIAHEVEADLFISLHADSLTGGGAHGATIYILSDSASDEASEKLAERHNRADMLSGVDLTGKDDVVAGVLMDLARMETQPRTDRLAQAIVEGVGARGLPLNKRAIRSAGFSVLKAPDIPSILLEVGFMSSKRDLENLKSESFRLEMARAIVDGIMSWEAEDMATRALLRQ